MARPRRPERSNITQGNTGQAQVTFQQRDEIAMRLSKHICFLLVMVFALPCFAGPVDLSKRSFLSAQDAASLDQKVIYLDVRSTSEWEAGHIKGSTHIPHNKVAATVTSLLPDRSVPIIVYCSSGGRAMSVIDALRARGYTAVPVTRGGYLQLIAHGMEKE